MCTWACCGEAGSHTVIPIPCVLCCAVLALGVKGKGGGLHALTATLTLLILNKQFPEDSHCLVHTCLQPY